LGLTGRQIATQLKPEVITFELELLDIAITKECDQFTQLAVIELHGDQFSRPR
jgi:hypothetical protein